MSTAGSSTKASPGVDDRHSHPGQRPPPIDYRAGGPTSKSQWWTDDQAYGACLVYGLLGLTALAAVGGGVFWLVMHFFGWWPF